MRYFLVKIKGSNIQSYLTIDLYIIAKGEDARHKRDEDSGSSYIQFEAERYNTQCPKIKIEKVIFRPSC